MITRRALWTAIVCTLLIGAAHTSGAASVDVPFETTNNLKAPFSFPLPVGMDCRQTSRTGTFYPHCPNKASAIECPTLTITDGQASSGQFDRGAYADNCGKCVYIVRCEQKAALAASEAPGSAAGERASSDYEDSLRPWYVEDRILAFSFGVVFALLLLWITTRATPLHAQGQFVVRVLLSLVAGCIGALIPGLVNLDLPFLRATGAAVLFIVVYWWEPGRKPAPDR